VASVPGAMTVKEFCEKTRTGKSNVYRLIKAGKLVARKIGTKTVILERDYLAFLDGLPKLPAATTQQAK
jgi:excisionase family DNA binding protein